MLPCPNWDVDNHGINRYNGCEIPGDNSTCFWQQPVTGRLHAQQHCSGQSLGGMHLRGGCGDSAGCSGATCDEFQGGVLLEEESCRRARDGEYRCGGHASCRITSGFACDRDYLDEVLWGTNVGFERLTLNTIASAVGNHQLTSDEYNFCDLAEDEDVAREVCNITGAQTNGVDTIFCRCGQVDFCGLRSHTTQDLDPLPVNLRVESLRMEQYLGSDPRDGHVNTFYHHRLVVEFAIENRNMDGSIIPQDMLNRQILYTRLIEVCPINVGANVDGNWGNPYNWRLRNEDQCVIKRVDGNLNAEALTINIPISSHGTVITKDDVSEGPWSVRFRTINDVCNRTYGDYVVSEGHTKNCRSGPGGTTCIEIGRGANPSYRCETGRFGGIRSRGNAPMGAYGNELTQTFNYCAIRN